MKRIFVLAAALLATTSSAAAPPTADEVVARHEASVAAIRTLSAQYAWTKHEDDGAKPGDRGEYARADGKVLMRRGASATVVAGGTARAVSRGVNQEGKRWFSAGVMAANEQVEPGDVFLQFLVEGFGGPGKARLTLGELFRASETTPELVEVDLAGRLHVRVEVRFTIQGDNKPVHFRLWHDPARGYLVARTEWVHQALPSRVTVTEVDGWESQNGVSFPTRQSRYRVQSGTRSGGQTVTLSNLRLNHRLPDRTFDLPTFPDGTQCIDHVSGTEYPINGRWQAVGPAKPFVPYGVPPQAPPGERPDVPGAPSVSEAPDWSGWLLVGLAVALLLFAGGLALRRRRRS